jgi:uncharacterized protein DUF4158
MCNLLSSLTMQYFRFHFSHGHSSSKMPHLPLFYPVLCGENCRFSGLWEIAAGCCGEVGMTGDYPRFKASYAHEELVQHFLLSPADRTLVDTCRGDVNRHGVAVLLKAVQYLGYFPDDLRQVPEAVRTFIAHQLQLLRDHTEDYPRHHSTRDVHVALIRQHTGFRFPTSQDEQALETWLGTHGAVEAPTEEDLCERAYARFRACGLELPAESELRRIVRAALHGFFHDLYTRVTAQLSETVRATLDQLLVVGPDETQSPFDRLKTEPSAPGVQHLQQEVAKLQTLPKFAPQCSRQSRRLGGG